MGPARCRKLGWGCLLAPACALLSICIFCLPSPTRLLPPLPPLAAALFGMYMLLKFFPDISIQGFLNCYFWLLGSVSMVGVFGPTLRTLVRRGVEGGGFVGKPTVGSPGA